MNNDLYISLRKRGMTHEAASLDVAIVELMREIRALSDIPELAAGARVDRTESINAACDALAAMRKEQGQNA
jgi:hypothetical protein